MSDASKPYRVVLEVDVWASDEDDAAGRAVDVCHSRSRGVRNPAVQTVEPRPRDATSPDLRIAAAAQALRDLGIQAEAPDQSGNAAGFQERLVLNVRGICVDEFEDWVSIELRHLDPTSEWFETPSEAMPPADSIWLGDPD